MFALAAIPLAASVYAVPGDFVGSEFRANTYRTDSQAEASVAWDHAGNAVVVWWSLNQDSSFGGIYGQRYGADGKSVGAEFRVNQTTNWSQYAPDVAMDAAGNFVVTWQSSYEDGTVDIFAQRYSAQGAAQGGEFRINSFTTGDQTSPTVAMNDSGAFVIAWSSAAQDGSGLGIYAQRYSAGGVAQGAEFRVNTVTADDQQNADAAMAANGDFVVAWQSFGQDTGDASTFSTGVYAQRYNGSGAALGAAFRVNATTNYSQQSPAAAMGALGDFIIAWNGNGTGDSTGIFARRYDNAGNALSSEFLVNTTTASTQGSAAIGCDLGGNFVVTWHGSDASTGTPEVFARRFSASGAAVGGETRINTFMVGDQIASAVAVDADGDFVVVWQGNRLDGFGYDIYGQRIQGPEDVDLSVVLTDWPDPVSTGGAVDYAVRVTNSHAPATHASVGLATGIVAGFLVPDGTSVNTAAGTNWTCSIAATVSCSYGAPLAAGTMANLLHINVSAPATVGTIEASVSAGGQQFDSDQSDNADSESTTVAVPPDTNPDAFTFTDLVNRPAVAPQLSDIVTISGINTPTPISISGDSTARYSINGGAYVASGGTVSNGNTVRLRMTSAQPVGGAVAAMLTIGDRSDEWRVTTGSDSTPNDFSFPDVPSAAAEVVTTSASRTIVGFNGSLPISISGAGATYSIDGSAYTAVAGTITNGNVVRLRLTSARPTGATQSATISIGSLSDTWVVTTAADSTPKAFNFVDKTNQAQGINILSGLVTLSAFNQPVAISISGDTSASYSLNGATYTSAPGTANASDTVRLRLTSASVPSTTRTATITIGGVSDVWNVSTAP